jgi:hypothetical protein
LTSACSDVLFLFVPRQPEKQARAEAMLGEIAELALMVTRELAVRLRESEDVEETVALATAFQKTSRVVRLTLALDFKLDRDAVREAREAKVAEAEMAATPPAPARAPKLKPPGADPVLDKIDALFWAESEGDEEDFERLHEELEERLYVATSNPDFKDTPIEAVIEQVIADMGVSGALKFSLSRRRAHSPPLMGRDRSRSDQGREVRFKS